MAKPSLPPPELENGSFPPELAKGSLLPNGSLPKGSEDVTGDFLLPLPDFALGGAGLGGGCFFVLGGKAGVGDSDFLRGVGLGANGSLPKGSPLVL